MARIAYSVGTTTEPYINLSSSIIFVEDNRQTLNQNPCRFSVAGDDEYDH